MRRPRRHDADQGSDRVRLHHHAGDGKSKTRLVGRAMLRRHRWAALAARPLYRRGGHRSLRGLRAASITPSRRALAEDLHVRLGGDCRNAEIARSSTRTTSSSAQRPSSSEIRMPPRPSSSSGPARSARWRAIPNCTVSAGPRSCRHRNSPRLVRISLSSPRAAWLRPRSSRSSPRAIGPSTA